MRADGKAGQTIINALEKQGVICFVPQGNSMLPFIKNRKGSVIIEKSIDNLQKFDVVFFIRENNEAVLHRIIDIDEDCFIVCGDAQLSTEKVKREQILGVMTGFYDGKKYIDAKNPKYLKSVEKWYKHNSYRKLRIKFFHLKEKILHKKKKHKSGE